MSETVFNLSDENFVDQIHKIQKVVQKEFDLRQNLEQAIDDSNWELAYKIASEAGINIYDPFASLREAETIVAKVNKSVNSVKKQSNIVRAWSVLQTWSAALLELDLAQVDSFPMNLDNYMTHLAGHEMQSITNWRTELQEETDFLKKVENVKDLRSIELRLLNEQPITGEDINYLQMIRNYLPESRIIGSIYAKAIERYLNTPDALVSKFTAGFFALEQAFITSNSDNFERIIGKLEIELVDEKNFILQLIYRTHLHFWKQRQRSWKKSIDLLTLVRKLAEEANGNEIDFWKDDTQLAKLGTVLVELQTISPEFLVLKAPMELRFNAYQIIKNAVVEIQNTLEFPKEKTQPSGFLQSIKQWLGYMEVIMVDESTVAEWRVYLADTLQWLEKAAHIGEQTLGLVYMKGISPGNTGGTIAEADSPTTL